MSLKYSNTTADFLQWDEAMNLIRKLFKDSNYNMSLLVALGCFFGLRISDILALRWNQILNVSEFTIIEHKTDKKRTIRINPQLQRHIAECYKAIKPLGKSSPILVSQKGTVYSIQRINIILKEAPLVPDISNIYGSLHISCRFLYFLPNGHLCRLTIWRAPGSCGRRNIASCTRPPPSGISLHIYLSLEL